MEILLRQFLMEDISAFPIKMRKIEKFCCLNWLWIKLCPSIALLLKNYPKSMSSMKIQILSISQKIRKNSTSSLINLKLRIKIRLFSSFRSSTIFEESKISRSGILVIFSAKTVQPIQQHSTVKIKRNYFVLSAMKKGIEVKRKKLT